MKIKKGNKKRGFTLVELLGTIVILGILTTIAIVGVNKTLESAHDKFYDKQKEMFKMSGQEYFTDHKELLPSINYGTNRVFLNKLIEENYINKIVDYKKRTCDPEKSYISVTRLNASKYEYDVYLVCPDKKIVDNYDGSVAGKSTVNLIYNSGGNYNNADKKYYTNDTISFDLVISNVDGLSGYKYVLYKSDKKYMTSEVISAASNKEKIISDRITINKETCSDGEYYIGIIPIDKNGNKQSVQQKTNIKVVIDTKKPKCNIVLPKKEEGINYVNDWYNEKAGDATIEANDTNLDSYAITTNSTPIYNNNKTLSLQNTTQEGQILYGYAKDKAGNEGICPTDVIKVDKSKPDCRVTTNISANGNGWFTSVPTIYLNNNSIKDNGNSGIYSYGLSTNADNYNKQSSNTQGETQGKTWYGVIKDYAGNTNSCTSSLLKVDTTGPTCTNTPNYGSWTDSSRVIKYGCSDNISGCIGGGTATVSNLITYEKSYTVTNGAGISKACNAKVKVYSDTKKPSTTISNAYNNKWVKNDYTFVVNTNVGISGICKLQRSIDDGSYTDISTNETRYTTSKWEKGRDSTVKYRAVSCANVTGEAGSTTVKLDKVAPKITKDTLLENAECPNDNDNVYSYVLTYTVKDCADADCDYNGSGYVGGEFTWPSGIEKPTYNHLTGSSKHYICSSGKTGSYSYVLKDDVGNTSTRDSRKMNGSS